MYNKMYKAHYYVNFFLKMYTIIYNIFSKSEHHQKYISKPLLVKCDSTSLHSSIPFSHILSFILQNFVLRKSQQQKPYFMQSIALAFCERLKWQGSNTVHAAFS